MDMEVNGLQLDLFTLLIIILYYLRRIESKLDYLVRSDMR
jgi:hypothetical protein